MKLAALVAAYLQHYFGAAKRRRKKNKQILGMSTPSTSFSHREVKTPELITTGYLALGEIAATDNPPSSSYSYENNTRALDHHQVIVDAVNRLGGPKKATPEALLHELMNYEGLNLLDVERQLQKLERHASPQGSELCAESISEEELDHKESGVVDEKSSFIRIGNNNRDLVRQNLRAKLLDLGLPNEEIESQLEVEESMWLFCSLFPEDYEFDKDTLVQLWIALHLINGEHKYHIGDFYFEILVSNGYVSQTRTIFPNGKYVYKVNVNRLMNGVDFMMRKELYLRTRDLNDHEPSSKVRHVSLVGDDVDETILETLMDFKELKALLLLCKEAPNINKIPQDVFSALKNLEVLDLSRTCIRELPSSVGYLVELRYLDLSLTLIELLPETIDRLLKLQTLKLKDCEHLFRLPKGIGNLTSLEHLELDVLSQLDFMPRGMGKLTNLETLSAFLVDRDEGRSIKELKNVNNLKGRFCISRLENVLSPDEAKEAALSEKKYIKELELRWSHDLLSSSLHHGDDEILQMLSPNSNLEQLYITCYNGLKFPNWVSDSSLVILTSITLFRCENTNILPSFGQLPSLKHLSLVEMKSVKEIGDEFRGKTDNHVAFPKLEKLAIVGFFRLESWREAREGDFPSLCSLVIERCPKLIALPSSPVCLYTLKHLEIIHCIDLASLPEKNLSTFLVTLIIEDCPVIEKRLRKRKGREWNKIEHVQSVWIGQEEITKVT